MSANLEVKQFLNMIPGFARNKKKNDNEEFFIAVAKARDEWYDAQNYFENAVENELIDHAIYKMEAAKSKYMYLLKQAKQYGIKMNI